LTGSHYKLSKPRMLRLLEEFKANSIEIASLCVPPARSRLDVEGLLESILDLEKVPEDIARYMAESPTGAFLFWGPHHRFLIMPPFPVAEESVSPACEIEPLYTLLHQEFWLGLILVRLGAFGIGVVRGDVLVSSKVGTGLVHGRHRQGGSSAHRFERHREKQMETFFTRVCAYTREQLEPYARQLDYVLYGGARETLLEFRKQCQFTRQLDNRTLDLLLNIREPKQAGLKEAVQEAWSSRVIQWND
jgi:peptide subunit release factor 1 (eRF1)